MEMWLPSGGILVAILSIIAGIITIIWPHIIAYIIGIYLIIVGILGLIAVM
ncbi:MAG: DUF3096 domain-containing protein [Dehalococcoidales bacterium]|nr:DUF3096 domain-containing protein [Dehalococcoidales bacterium]